MQPDINFILSILGAKEVEIVQLRQTLMAMEAKIKELTPQPTGETK